METLALDLAIHLLVVGFWIMVDARGEQRADPGTRASGMRTSGIFCVAILLMSAIPDSLFWSSASGLLILLLFIAALVLHQALRDRQGKPVEPIWGTEGRTGITRARTVPDSPHERASPRVPDHVPGPAHPPDVPGLWSVWQRVGSWTRGFNERRPPCLD